MEFVGRSVFRNQETHSMARPNAHRGEKRGVMTIADMVADPPMAYEALKDGVRCRICG
jgi:hypothetical protein